LEKIEIATHRGGSKRFPENSLAAFLESWAHLAIPEMDIQRLSDGLLLVCHDETLDRTVQNLPSSLKNRPLGEISSKEIKELILETQLKGFSPPVPLFEEVLQYVQKDPKKQIFIDNKSASLTREILPLIEYYRIEKQCWVTGTSLSDLEEAKKLLPTIHTQVWVNAPSLEEVDSLFTKALANCCIDSVLFVLAKSRKATSSFHLPHWYIKESELKCRKKKHSLAVYYTQYTRPLFQELRSLGVRRFAVDVLEDFKQLL
jgi:glycerophosphoryl diester phosphodiesterase